MTKVTSVFLNAASARTRSSSSCATVTVSLESILKNASNPRWSKAGESAALEAASSSTRVSGCAPSGPASPLGAPSQPVGAS
eukprot:scaffold56224_cov63-Phaeocystis_antarctica.AAC.4